MTRRAGWFAVVALVLVAGRATAAGPDDEDDDAPDERPFWARVQHPHHERYQALITQGGSLASRGDRAAAIEVYAKAVALEPDELEARFYLGVTMGEAGQWERCADTLVVVRDRDPEYDSPTEGIDSVGLELATCELMAGRWEDAIASARRALVAPIEPKDTTRVWFAIGDASMELGHLDDAIDAYRRAQSYGRYAVPTLVALAVALDRAGDAAGSAESVRRATMIDGTADVVSLMQVLWVRPEEKDYALGLVHEVMGRRARARFHFRTFVATAPRSPWLERAKGHLAALEGGAVLDDVVAPAGAIPGERAATQQAFVKVAPALARCLDGHPTMIARVEVPTLLGGRGSQAAASPSRPVVTVTRGGPDPGPSPQACLERVAAGVKLPKSVTGRATLWVTGAP